MQRYLLVSLSLLSFHFSFAQPTPRASAQLFYIKSTGSLVLFDGYEKGTTPSSGKAETWAWKNNSWTKTDETNQPLRSLSGAAYLKDKDKLFVFGGVGSNGYDDSLKQAWLYDGQVWSLVADSSIGTRDHHEMAYDENNKMIVVYGGQTGNRQFDSRTWIYKNDKWTALDIPGPGPRVHHAMVYDPERKKIILFGGNGVDRAYDETWEFDGTQWKKIEVSINPGARSHHCMVYDRSRKKVLLYGGDIGTETQGDLWAWDGNKWERLSNNGPSRLLAAAAFDPSNNKLYVFGGNGGEHGMLIYSDLWEWDDGNWKQVDKGSVYEWDNGKDRYMPKK